jgi:DNA-binding response OmpR family regulator
MNSCVRFLVVDDNAESRYLLAKTLLQKSPHAVVLECQSAEAAFALAEENHLAAVIVHRAIGASGVELIRGIRERSPQVPIIMVSGLDRRVEATEAGADRFVPFDEWPRIHTILEDVSIHRASSPRTVMRREATADR